MNPNNTERTTYHLINLEDQQFFPGNVDIHQSLGMDKTQRMNAITSQAAQPFGLAYEKTAAEGAVKQTAVQEMSSAAEAEAALPAGIEFGAVLEVDTALPEAIEAVVVPEIEMSLPGPIEVIAVPENEAMKRESELPDLHNQDDFERLIATNVSHDTEYLLQDVQDVQDTLGSLTGMANRLAEQKKDTLKQQKILHGRDTVLQEKERFLSVKEEDMRQLHKQLLHDRNLLGQEAESNAQMIAERSATLQQLAESLEARERANARRADLLQQENTRTDELSALLRKRLAQLQKRKGELERRGQELNENLKQLRSAKDRFSAIVKSFNETVNLRGDSQPAEPRAEQGEGE